MKTLNYQYKKQWMDGRKKRISATDIPVLMKSNTNNGGKQYKTRSQLMDAKLGLVEREDLSQNSLVQWGNDTEDVHARKVQAKFPEYEVIYPGPWAVQVHPEHDWASCTADFFMSHGDTGNEIGPLECKTGDHKKWITPPQMYIDQLQWQMFVTDMHEGWLSVMLLPEHEETRTKEVMEDARVRTVSASIRYEYLEACRYAVEGTQDTRSMGMPRIARALEESTVRVFQYYADQDRIERMKKAALEFHEELTERQKEIKKETK